MERNTAPGPDHIPVEFFQTCREVIKYDMLLMFEEFDRHNLDMERLNYGIITLLLKTKEANKIQQYRLICLLNVVYKIFTENLMLRMEKNTRKNFKQMSNSLLKRQNIMEGVMSLHEILRDTKVRKKGGLILKLDFEKA